MKSPITFVCLIVTLFLSGLSYGQQTCSNGRCYQSTGIVRNTVYGTATVVGSVVQSAGTVVASTVRTTGTIVERIVDTTGEVLTRTVDAAGNVVYTTARVAVSPIQGLATGLAQSKAERQAAMQQCCHVGGSFGGARYEGVGFSTVSPEDAVRRCCYSNRPIRESGVTYGYNRQLKCHGWFATILCD
jgi:hypothetical protein